MNWTKNLNRIAVLVVFLILSAYFFHPIPILTVDLGYYLKTGQIIYQTKSIPSTNLFSYTYPNFPFINPNWLSEVILYQTFSLFGFNGLIVLSTLLIICAFSIIFIPAAKESGVFSSAMVALLYLQVLYERTQVKPELFSYLFLGIFIAILYRFRKGYTKLIYALIPLELLWVNIHIYFFIGIAVLLLFLVDAAISQKNEVSSKKISALLWVTIASSIVTLFNPNFIKGATYPLYFFNNYGVPVQENIMYFAAVTSHAYNDSTFLFFGIAIIILWLSTLLSLKRLSSIDILLSLFFTCLGLMAIRAFALFVLGTFIPCVKANTNLISNVSNKLTPTKTSKFYFKTATFLVVCGLLFQTIKSNTTVQGIGLGVIDNAQDAITFLQANNLKGPIFNTYNIGSYLNFRLYPREQIFVDNRPEAYPKEFFQNVYFPMEKSPAVFNQVADKYNFNLLIFDHTNTSDQENQLLYQLVRSSDWKTIYINNTVIIFLKNSSANQAFIKNHLIEENTLVVSNSDLNNKDKVRQLANLFKNLGWYQQMLRMNLKYLYYVPTDCGALKNVAILLQIDGNPEASGYTTKYFQLCQEN